MEEISYLQIWQICLDKSCSFQQGYLVGDGVPKPFHATVDD
jgi:hypothetical protein